LAKISTMREAGRKGLAGAIQMHFMCQRNVKGRWRALWTLRDWRVEGLKAAGGEMRLTVPATLVATQNSN